MSLHLHHLHKNVRIHEYTWICKLEAAPMSSYQLEYVALTLVTNVTNRLAHVRRRHFLTDLFIYQQTNLSEHNVTMTTTVSSSLTWAKLARQIFLRITSSVIGAELWRPNLSSYVAPPLNRLDGRTKKVSFLTFYSKINIRVTLKSNIFIILTYF